MSYSANEIMGLALKAARGAGAPPEQAMWFGRAAAVHLASGRASEDLSRALGALPGGDILSLHLEIITLQAQADAQGVATGQLEAESPNGLVRSYLEALPFHAEVTDQAPHRWQVRFDTRRPAAAHPAVRAEMPDRLAQLMQRLAERTFVPESDASRAAGAGAGLTDND